MRERIVSKVIKKWMYNYHFSNYITQEFYDDINNTNVTPFIRDRSSTTYI